MKSFQYATTIPRVIFGSGTIKQLPSLVDDLSMKAIMILSTPQQKATASQIGVILGQRLTAVFDGAVMHTPTSVTDVALAQLKECKVDGIVSIGGGSTIGLGKALSIRTGLPHVCVPTTYAGSEMTPILGETQSGQKVTRRDPKILPTAVLYDIDYTMTLPIAMSIHSGINAIAHAVEALYAKNINPIISLMACEGIRALCESLPIIQKDPSSPEARYDALYGSWLCGICLGATDMALHHKLCHTLGGTFDLPHAETHVTMLPHALAYNASWAPEAMEKLAAIFPDSNGSAIDGINNLYQRLGIDVSLRSLGMPQDGIESAVERAMANPYFNPRPLEGDQLQALISRAWHGEKAQQ